ncbi:hypothetical protein [Salegentibacter sediminis]|uniref:hypothetical protein n=1 Tax=Salegentibacter sediminis TaxID=1930251 RepID=UPI0009BFB31F|nr:hypothetical protein [Salegentibacter sediminis]
MKNLIFYSLLICFIATAQSQEITELEEARVTLNPISEKLTGNVDELTFKVKEEYTGEFMQNPLGFMMNNFNVWNLIDQFDKEYDSYRVSFRTSKGSLNAEFDDDGELKRHNQSFRDVVLSRKIMADLYRDHKGWAAVGNKYVAYGTGEKIDKAFYKIKLVNGNRSQTIKIEQQAADGRLAEIEREK